MVIPPHRIPLHIGLQIRAPDPHTRIADILLPLLHVGPRADVAGLQTIAVAAEVGGYVPVILDAAFFAVDDGGG